MGRFSAVHSYSQKRTLLRIHADKSLSNLSGIECPVRITFWSLIFPAMHQLLDMRRFADGESLYSPAVHDEI